MAAVVVSFTQGVTTANTNAQNLVALDTIIVSRAALLFATGIGDSRAVSGVSDNFMTINGEVYSALSHAIFATFGGHRIAIGPDGVVNGFLTAIRLGAGSNVITNDGFLSSMSSEVLRIDGTGGNTIVNNGTIQGTGVSSDGIFVFGANNYIENNGTITTGNDDGITIGGAAASFSPTAFNTFINRGLISSGDGFAIAGGFDRDEVINRGALNGGVSLGEGNDLYDGAGGTVVGGIFGGGGDDVFIGGDQIDFFDGGSGSDTISYAGHATAVIVDASVGLAWDHVQLETIANIENAIGTAGNDAFFGNAADNTFDGGPGGADVMLGGSGRDTISYASSIRGVIVDLTAQQTYDGIFLDRLESIENAIGSAGNDSMFGNGGDNVLDPGAAGADTVNGGAGNDTVSYASSRLGVIIDLNAQATFDGVFADTLVSIENAVGSAFGDQIFAGANANTITGGRGGDTIVTGGGADRVVFNDLADGLDTITDFQAGVDKIVLRTAGFNGLSVLTPGVNFFASAAPAPLNTGPTVLYNTTTGVISFDPDGTGTVIFPNFIATLTGAPALTVADFQFI